MAMFRIQFWLLGKRFANKRGAVFLSGRVTFYLCPENEKKYTYIEFDVPKCFHFICFRLPVRWGARFGVSAYI